MPSLPWLLGPYWPMVEVDINAVAPRSRADSARTFSISSFASAAENDPANLVLGESRYLALTGSAATMPLLRSAGGAIPAWIGIAPEVCQRR